MLKSLNDTQYKALKSVLHGDDGEELCMSICDITLGREPEKRAKFFSIMNNLGLHDERGLTLTGQLCCDSLREFGFWLERDRKLPSENCSPKLRKAYFKDKRILELGSGCGCNLLSLAEISTTLFGLEPMPIYRQMSSLLSKMIGLPIPNVTDGIAEDIPFEDNSFDIVLMYTSHQYMDIDVVATEIARVLDKQGELLMIGNTLYHFIIESAATLVKSRDVGKAKYDITSIINTIWYQSFGNRLIKGDAYNTTSTPIYPSYRYLRKLLLNAGLKVNEKETMTLDSSESLIVANMT